jgi:NitT/TauT family transport system substrate-binding protein
VEKIKIALGNRGAGTAPVFATVEGGYFHEQGLDPELVPHQGHSRSLRALIMGEADFTNAVGAEVIMANRRHGGDAVVVASAISRSAQQVSARPGLATRADLRGKRWGVVARQDADECSIAMAFERWGWDLARDAEIVVVGSDGPRLDLLLDERCVDVAIMHAPEPFQAVRRGWRVVEDLGRLDVAFQNSCAVTTRRLMHAQPELVQAYVRAPTAEACSDSAPTLRSASRSYATILAKPTTPFSRRHGYRLRGSWVA